MTDLEQILKDVIKQLFNKSIDLMLARPDEKFGDFTTNVALRLAPDLNQPPRDIAAQIVNNLPANNAIANADIAGPGFINVTLTDSVLAQSIGAVAESAFAGKSIVIETNNPNPFKAMHIGHAFNAILADTIANLLEAGKANIHRVSYHGDVGAHVGKSMYSILKFIDGDVSKLQAIPPAERNSFMSRMYAEGSSAYKGDIATKARIDTLAQQSFTLDDPLYRQAYEICKQWSFEHIDDLVARLGNKPIEKRYLESQADAMGVQTVKDHIGTVFVESDGALVFPGEKYGSFNNVFVSSSGRGLYGARDLGLIQLKNNDYHAEKSYIVTAEEQRDYFKGVIKAAELCLPELTGVTVNIPTGMVKLTSGKMSSRSGDVVEVDSLFDQVTNALRASGKEPYPEVIIGALRYQFLKVRIGGDVIFDVDESISLHGNSGPYIQYAYVRAQSILQKSAQTVDIDLKAQQFDVSERRLLRTISEFTSVMEQAQRDLLPHYVCTYLFELTQSFNRFYEQSRVIGHEREQIRLALVGLYAQTLQSGLDVLGIPTPAKM